LDVNQRAMVVLVDLNGLDYLEAAQILGIPLGTVKSRLARARLRLKQLLNTD
jgi:DNA-directed RNA polymerase specialized sigma24 family protein